ncbi:MAG: hypothetical protein AB7P04_07435 [Bacteriovoracia bacterium]
MSVILGASGSNASNIAAISLTGVSSNSDDPFSARLVVATHTTSQLQTAIRLNLCRLMLDLSFI